MFLFTLRLSFAPDFFLLFFSFKNHHTLFAFFLFLLDFACFLFLFFFHIKLGNFGMYFFVVVFAYFASSFEQPVPLFLAFFFRLLF